MLVYLDGRYVAKEEARISVDDRGFLFGDGVYEVARALGGRLFAEILHWERLERGLRELGIRGDSIPDREGLRGIAERLLEENGLATTDATVYVQITRGAAPRTHYYPPPSVSPTVYLSVAKVATPTELRRNGGRAITHPDLRWSRCDIKTVNLLPNAMAKERAHEAGAVEAILVRDGAMTEGSSSNAFAVVGGEIRTYPLSNYILPGVTRHVVIEMARGLGHSVVETPVFVEQFGDVDEIFLTGTTTDVQPVIELDGRTVGDGKPGPVTKSLREALARRMEETAGTLTGI